MTNIGYLQGQKSFHLVHPLYLPFSSFSFLDNNLSIRLAYRLALLTSDTIFSPFCAVSLSYAICVSFLIELSLSLPLPLPLRAVGLGLGFINGQ